MYEQISYSELAHRLYLARAGRIEKAAGAVVEAALDDSVTPKQWAFDVPAPIREAIIDLDGALDARR